MPVESRTRITLFLPAPKTLQQLSLVDQVITELLQTCEGVTVSADSVPPTFTGLWLDANKQTIRDANILIIADAPVPLGDAGLAVYLDSLKPNCQKLFAQDIVWVTVHSVGRVTTDDFKR